MDNDIILKPLTENYQCIKIWVTDLESFMQCPKKFKTVPYVQTEAQKVGNKADRVIKNFLHNKDHYAKLYEFFIETETDPMVRKWLWEYMDLCIEHNIPEVLHNDEKMSLTIEAWKYLLEIRWIFDCLHIDWSISDIKTAEHKRDTGKEYEMLQPYIYTYAFWKQYWQEEWRKRFYYYIFSKHKRDRCTLDTRTMMIDLSMAKKKIIEAAKKYLIAYHINERACIKNKYCRWCQLFKDNKCEVFNSLLTKYEDTN